MIRLLFIVNPISGKGQKIRVVDQIQDYFKGKDFVVTIKFTEYAKHAIVICKDAILSGSTDAIIAVGGDGTINEVVNGIGRTGMPMGIIPLGSGNGLARHLGIPLVVPKALANIEKFNIQPIDLIKTKNHYAANVIGVGFDAIVAWQFKNKGTRGLATYIQVILEEFLSYQPKNYEITIDGNTFSTQAALITVANSSQFGNNAFIAPKASIVDGLMDVCVIKPFPKALSLQMAGMLMTKTLHLSKYYEHYNAKQVKIVQEKSALQIDGEAIKQKRKVKVKLYRGKLKMIIPVKMKGKI